MEDELKSKLVAVAREYREAVTPTIDPTDEQSILKSLRARIAHGKRPTVVVDGFVFGIGERDVNGNLRLSVRACDVL